MVDHPSHVTRFSDSSHYDEICVLCGTTDGVGSLLEAACPVGRNLHQTHSLEVLYYPERTERKRVRCTTCGETSLDALTFECSAPSSEKIIHKFEDVDVMRKIEGLDGREGPTWMDEMVRDGEAETLTNAEFARGGVVTAICPDRPAFLNRTIDECSAGIEPMMEPSYNRDIKTVSHLTDVINTILLTRACPETLHSAINAIRTTLLNISTPVPIVVNIDSEKLSLTEKIGKLIAEEGQKIGLRMPVRHTPREQKASEEQREALDAKKALHDAHEADRLRLAKLAHAAGINEDGMRPQHGTKLPDADFVPLYRSEKDA